MKPLNQLNQPKQLILLGILALASLAIWIGGPYISFSGYYAFESPAKRLYLIMVLMLLWILKLYLFDFPYAKTLSILPQDKLIKFAAMRARFKDMIRFLKKTPLQKKDGADINLFHLPWYLLIGANGSGKTTLLANSDVNYVLAKQFKNKLSQLPPSDNYDWWVTRDLVLVDVPGSYIFEENTNKPQPSRYLWQGFIDLTKRYRKYRPLSGTIITLNLPEIIKSGSIDINSLIFVLRNTLSKIVYEFGQHLPVYFVITKCDLLPGFTEFFGDCTSNELSQLWGVTIPPLAPGEKLSEIFSQRFNALIKRLNKQLLSRLHQERNPNARAPIKDFPLQVERLKEALVHFLKALRLPDLNLQGVYLTSAIQSSEENSKSALTYQHQAQNALQTLFQSPAKDKSFFIKQLITQGLLNTFDPNPKPYAASGIWKHRLSYVSAASVIALAAYVLGTDFQKSVQQEYSLRNLLAQYHSALGKQTAGSNHLIEALPLLDALHDCATQVHSKSAFLSDYLNSYSKKSEQSEKQIYNQALQTIIFPEIKNYLESYLKKPTNQSPVQLYAVLKAYLMLGDNQNINADFIANTIALLLPNKFDKSHRDQIANHLQAALSELHPLTLDQRLIVKARDSLFNLTQEQLAFVILNNMGNNNISSNISLGINTGPSSPLVSKNITNQIANLFTADYFQNVISQDIPVAAKEAAAGNWVLGELPTRPTPTDEATLAQDVQRQYLSRYVDIWESLLANIQLNTSHNLTELDLMLSNLTGDTSPLLQLLHTLRQQTNIQPVLEASPKLRALNANSYDLIFASMRETHQFLQIILRGSNIGEGAFHVAKSRFEHSGRNDPIAELREVVEQNPEPLKTWGNKLADDSWRFIMEESNHFIEARWKDNLIPLYKTMANRYPLKSNAKEDIDLKTFIDFYAPDGKLISFYKTYLKPFVNDTTKDWDWKQFENQQPTFSKSILQQVQAIALLQHAIFPNGDSKLYVPFSLQPVALDKNSHVNLTINGQQVSYRKSDSKIPRTLTWPGNNIRNPWSWLRIVNQSTQNIISEKQLMLSLNADNRNTKFMLYTQGHINPFLPANWEKLKLPLDLA